MARRPLPRPALEGQVALVTGAGAGLGRAVAHALAEAGARVMVGDRDEASARAVARELGSRALAQRVDVAEEPDVAALVARAEAELGPLTVAINNAAITPLTAEVEEAELRRVLAVNVSGVRHGLKHELAVMRPRRAGVIVNVASHLAQRPELGSLVYAASKAAVVGLTRTVGRTLAREGLRINALCPGGILTGMLRQSRTEADLVALAASVPAGRLSTPEELARVVLWLCGPEAELMVGHALVIDGGVVSW